MRTDKILLISVFLCIILFCVSTIAYADNEDDNTPLDISFGTVRTEAEKAALGILVSYIKKIDEEYLFTSADPKNAKPGSGWLFDISPEVEIQIGEEDAFNGLIAKFTGNYIRFETTKIGDYYTPCSDCFFHAFPLSFGFESDRNFENVSSLLELGYVPFYLKNKWKLGLKSKIGLFVQAGYKFEIEDNPEVKEGGSVPETEEEPDSEILRFKLDAGTQINLFSYSKGKQSVSLVPRVRLWSDMANSEIYHKYEATLKFSLGKDKSFDLKYEDGSGAPNFNEGEQFSANISIKY